LYQIRLSVLEAAGVRYTEHVFGPRLPGQTDLSVAVGENNDPIKQELTVLRKEIAALRIGMGAVFGSDAISPGYESKTPAGSDTAIVTETSGNFRMAGEIVLGAAPFIFDYLAYGGRSYADHDNLFVSPYFGVGLI